MGGGGNNSPRLAPIDRLRVALCASLAWVGAHANADDGAASAPQGRPLPVAVIELPSDTVALPGGARQRPHHALSIATDAPKPLLRSLGLDARDCALRLRLPTRLVPPRGSNVGTRIELQAQAGLACHF